MTPNLGEAAAEWASLRRLTLDEERWRYRQAGSGPPVVLVHGLGMASDYWVRTAPPLATAGFHVLAPDLPGFGASEGGGAAVGISEQVAALLRWGRALDIPPAVYVGHSLSCQTVVQLAVDAPHRVAGLVLAGPTGDGGGARRPREAGRLLLDAPREPLKLLVLAAQAYLRAGPIRFLRTWAEGTRHDPLPLLPRVRQPALVVVGEEDPVVPIEFAREYAARLRRGRLALVPGAPHAVFFDEPERFNAEVIGFLRSVDF